MQALRAQQLGRTTLLALTRPSYVIDQQALVNPLLAQMQASNIGQTIADLSAHTNRYYTSSGGVAASNWLKTRWSNLSAGRSDVTVEQFSHPSWAQKSVIATFKGTDNAAQILVLGAHLDSINTAGTTETARAPGADDDASGLASLTEIIRTLVGSGFKPRPSRRAAWQAPAAMTARAMAARRPRVAQSPAPAPAPAMPMPMSCSRAIAPAIPT